MIFSGKTVVGLYCAFGVLRSWGIRIPQWNISKSNYRWNSLYLVLKVNNSVRCQKGDSRSCCSSMCVLQQTFHTTSRHMHQVIAHTQSKPHITQIHCSSKQGQVHTADWGILLSCSCINTGWNEAKSLMRWERSDSLALKKTRPLSALSF